MKIKKLLAVILAAMLLFAAVPAFASPPPAYPFEALKNCPTQTGNNSNNTRFIQAVWLCMEPKLPQDIALWQLFRTTDRIGY